MQQESSSANTRPPEAQIVFLTYLSRSGSTYLAHHLNRYYDISVTLEADFPDGLFWRQLRITSPRQLNTLVDSMLRMRKFQQWGISREALRNGLSQCGYPIMFPQLLRTVLGISFAQTDTRIWVYKNGKYFRKLELLREHFPGSKVIFVMRDPRAVFNSQNQSINSDGRPMWTSPVHCALKYREAVSIVQRYQEQSWFHLVKYEDLIEEKDAELERVRHFLGAGPKICESRMDYAEMIPAAQTHLHRNVGKSSLPDRVGAWQTELSAGEIFSIQCIAKRGLTEHGYHSIEEGRFQLGDRCLFFWDCLQTAIAVLPIRSYRRLQRLKWPK